MLNMSTKDASGSRPMHFKEEISEYPGVTDAVLKDKGNLDSKSEAHQPEENDLKSGTNEKLTNSISVDTCVTTKSKFSSSEPAELSEEKSDEENTQLKVKKSDEDKAAALTSGLFGNTCRSDERQATLPPYDEMDVDSQLASPSLNSESNKPQQGIRTRGLSVVCQPLKTELTEDQTKTSNFHRSTRSAERRNQDVKNYSKMKEKSLNLSSSPGKKARTRADKGVSVAKQKSIFSKKESPANAKEKPGSKRNVSCSKEKGKGLSKRQKNNSNLKPISPYTGREVRQYVKKNTIFWKKKSLGEGVSLPRERVKGVGCKDQRVSAKVVSPITGKEVRPYMKRNTSFWKKKTQSLGEGVSLSKESVEGLPLEEKRAPVKGLSSPSGKEVKPCIKKNTSFWAEKNQSVHKGSKRSQHRDVETVGSKNSTGNKKENETKPKFKHTKIKSKGRRYKKSSLVQSKNNITKKYKEVAVQKRLRSLRSSQKETERTEIKVGNIVGLLTQKTLRSQKTAVKTETKSIKPVEQARAKKKERNPTSKIKEEPTIIPDCDVPPVVEMDYDRVMSPPPSLPGMEQVSLTMEKRMLVRGCDPCHQCCQKRAVDTYDNCTQWEDPEALYRQLMGLPPLPTPEMAHEIFPLLSALFPVNDGSSIIPSQVEQPQNSQHIDIIPADGCGSGQPETAYSMLQQQQPVEDGSMPQQMVAQPVSPSSSIVASQRNPLFACPVPPTDDVCSKLRTKLTQNGQKTFLQPNAAVYELDQAVDRSPQQQLFDKPTRNKLREKFRPKPVKPLISKSITTKKLPILSKTGTGSYTSLLVQTSHAQPLTHTSSTTLSSHPEKSKSSKQVCVASKAQGLASDSESEQGDDSGHSKGFVTVDEDPWEMETEPLCTEGSDENSEANQHLSKTNPYHDFPKASPYQEQLIKHLFNEIWEGKNLNGPIGKIISNNQTKQVPPVYSGDMSLNSTSKCLPLASTSRKNNHNTCASTPKLTTCAKSQLSALVKPVACLQSSPSETSSLQYQTMSDAHLLTDPPVNSQSQLLQARRCSPQIICADQSGSDWNPSHSLDQSQCSLPLSAITRMLKTAPSSPQVYNKKVMEISSTELALTVPGHRGENSDNFDSDFFTISDSDSNS